MRTLLMLDFLRHEAAKVLNAADASAFEMSQFQTATLLRSIASREGVSFEEGDIGLVILLDHAEYGSDAISEDSALAYSFRAQKLVFINQDAIELLEPSLSMPEDILEVCLAGEGECIGPVGWATCNSTQQAIDLCKEFVRLNSLGEATWIGGDLRHVLTKEIFGHIDVQGNFRPDIINDRNDVAPFSSTLKR